MFKEYKSKPVIRKAHEVTEEDKISFVPKDSTSLLSNSEIPLGVEFKHYEPVEIGDFIVYLNNEDIYHCSRKVFLERNIVE